MQIYDIDYKDEQRRVKYTTQPFGMMNRI